MISKSSVVLYLNPIQSVKPHRHRALFLVNSISDVTSKSGRFNHTPKSQQMSHFLFLNNLFFCSYLSLFFSIVLGSDRPFIWNSFLSAFFSSVTTCSFY